MRAPIKIRGLLSALALTATIAITAPEVQARDRNSRAAADESDVAAFEAGFGEALKAILPEVPPLSSEQEAALPDARRVAGQLIPKDAFADAMSKVMGPEFSKIAQLQDSSSILNALSNKTGLTEEVISARLKTPALQEQAVKIFDPAINERNKIVAAASKKMVLDMMTNMEPGYREGLARALATRFSTSELNQLSAMFSTPVGARFAQESMGLYSDPQLMAASAELAGQIFPAIVEFGANMEKAMEGLPAERSFSELSPKEQQTLAGMLGMDVKQLEASAALVAEDGSEDDEDAFEEDAAEAQ